MGRRLLPLVAGLMLVIATPIGAGAVSSKAGGPHACTVENTSTGAAYSNKSYLNPVQTAIDAAASGATLNIAGSCIGNFVIGRDLTLQGVATKKNPVATLDGNGVRPPDRSGVVLNILEPVMVTVRNLRITGGSNEPDGGGIYNHGSLTLIDSDVSDNHAFSIPPGQATRGGGIWNNGNLVITNSRVSQNSGGFGGGIYNPGGTVTITNSVISDNQGGSGGGIHNSFGTITLTNSTVSGNSDAGIANDRGSVTLTNSMVTGNSGSQGGGIFNFEGTVVLSGATMIQSNTSFFNGGGIFASGGTVSTSGWTGAVSGNTPDNCEPAMTLGGSICD